MTRKFDPSRHHLALDSAVAPARPGRTPAVSWSMRAACILGAAALAMVWLPTVEASGTAPGTMTPNPTTVAAGSTVSPLTLTYTNTSATTFTGTATIAVPSGWSAPQLTQPSSPGYVVVSAHTCTTAAAVSVTGNVINLNIQCAAHQNFVLSYTGNASTVAGPTTFTTMLKRLTGTAQPIKTQPVVTVAPGALDHISVSPASSSIAAGTVGVFASTGFDVYSNTIGDVTRSTTFALTPDGSCTASSCTALRPSAHTVHGTDGSATASASLAVTAGIVDHLVVAPGGSTVTSGQSQAYTAEGFDAAGNDLGDVTVATTFSITPDGSCSGASCSAAATGVHIVHATDGGAAGTATLSVVAAPSIISFTASASVVTQGSSTYLTGTFSNGTGIITNSSDANQQSISSGAPILVMPSSGGSVTYALKVTNAAGTFAIVNLTITVVQPPGISSFTTSQAYVSDSNSVTLMPFFFGGNGVVTNNHDGTSINVLSGSAVFVVPASDTTTVYTLTVTNAAGQSIQRTVSVTAVADPTISSFVANPSSISNGGTSTLTGACSVGSVGVVMVSNTPSSRVSVTCNGSSTWNVSVSPPPSTTTTYVLVVTNQAYVSVAATATVTTS